MRLQLLPLALPPVIATAAPAPAAPSRVAPDAGEPVAEPSAWETLREKEASSGAVATPERARLDASLAIARQDYTLLWLSAGIFGIRRPAVPPRDEALAEQLPSRLYAATGCIIDPPFMSASAYARAYNEIIISYVRTIGLDAAVAAQPAENPADLPAADGAG